MEKKETTT